MATRDPSHAPSDEIATELREIFEAAAGKETPGSPAQAQAPTSERTLGNEIHHLIAELADERAKPLGGSGSVG